MHRLLNRSGPVWDRAGFPVLALLFALVCVPVLVLFAVGVPAGEVPDEVAHIIRADSVRHGRLVGFRWWKLDFQGARVPDATVMADPGLLAAGFEFTPGVPLLQKLVTRARLDEMRALPWTNRLEPVSVTNTAVYPPTLYVPAAFAMQAAKYAGAGPFVSVLVARLMNAALYVALGAAALGLARRGRVVLFAALCLPMSLSLAASVNQDGLVIACCGLSAALLTRRGVRSWWSGVVLFAVAAMAKPYLLPLMLVVLATMPGSLRRHLGRAVGSVALAVGPAVAWGGAMGAFVATPFVKGAAHLGGPFYAGAAGTMFNTTNPGEQLRILLAVPSRLLSMPMQGVAAKGDWLWREMVGILGTLDVVFPFGFYTVWLWVLAGAVLAGFMANPFRDGGRGAVPGLAAIVGLVAAVWLAFVLQYLSWTDVGQTVIEGFQGRYIIPAAVIALPVAAFVPSGAREEGALRALLAVPVVVIAAVDTVVLPAVMLWSYYIR